MNMEENSSMEWKISTGPSRDFTKDRITLMIVDRITRDEVTRTPLERVKPRPRDAPSSVMAEHPNPSWGAGPRWASGDVCRPAAEAEAELGVSPRRSPVAGTWPGRPLQEGLASAHMGIVEPWAEHAPFHHRSTAFPHSTSHHQQFTASIPQMYTDQRRWLPMKEHTVIF